MWARLRTTLLLGLVAATVGAEGASATEPLTIGSTRGTIDFSIGSTVLFRTTGSFKEWKGVVLVDEDKVSDSRVEVSVRTSSVSMLDSQQTAMMKNSDFFDVTQFPEMRFQSKSVERTGTDTLKVTGDITLRGITRPMQFDVTVSDRKPDAARGSRYARFRATGSIKRSEFGITKFLDMMGDQVDLTIRTDAWR